MKRLIDRLMKRFKEWVEPFFEPLFTAWVGIVAHKLRSFLTILGITIGVGAVIALMSIGKGTEVSIVSGIQGLGTNLLFVQPGAVTQSGVRSAMGSATTLTSQDAEAISEVANITLVAPVSGTFSQVVAGGNNMNTRITGITPEYQQALGLQAAQGDLINQQLYESNAKVAVIGPTVKSTLFGDNDAVGQTLRYGNTIVHVIGVLQSKGTSALGSTDDAILVPLTTLRQTATQSRTSSGFSVVSSIIAQVSDQKYITGATADITNLLRYRHRLTATADNDFTITSQEDMVKALSQATSSITFLLGSIAAISLLVGGIGVMNIMLVSVVERTREIGIRKALGAEEMGIVIQFLIEAAVLTLTGGIIGIIMGWGTSFLISSMGTVVTFVSADMVVLAFTISVAIGVFFGFYPAWQASRLKPIEALRHE